MRLILQLSLPFPQKRVVILIQLISKLKLIISFLFLLIQGAILLLAVARNHPKVILKVSIAAHKFDGEQGETRDIIEEPAKSNGNLEDDNTPL